jgi:hypothetical protein
MASSGYTLRDVSSLPPSFLVDVLWFLIRMQDECMVVDSFQQLLTVYFIWCDLQNANLCDDRNLRSAF